MYYDTVTVTVKEKRNTSSKERVVLANDIPKAIVQLALSIVGNSTGLAAAKKKPFLADPRFLKYKGFVVCDEADNGIQLWYLSFDKDAEKPQFKECAKHPHIDEKGYVLYYTSQCPFNAKYVPVLERTAKENGIPFKAIHIESREEAQSAPTPITNYALFRDGEYVTNEQMNDKKFMKMVNG